MGTKRGLHELRKNCSEKSRQVLSSFPDSFQLSTELVDEEASKNVTAISILPSTSYKFQMLLSNLLKILSRLKRNGHVWERTSKRYSRFVRRNEWREPRIVTKNYDSSKRRARNAKGTPGQVFLNSATLAAKIRAEYYCHCNRMQNVSSALKRTISAR